MALPAGQLRYRVIIQEPTRTPDGGKGFTRGWAVHATVWGGVEPVTGSERFAGQQLEENVDYVVTIRARSTVTSKMRVVYGTKILAITAVLPDPRNESMRLLCRSEDHEEGV